MRISFKKSTTAQPEVEEVTTERTLPTRLPLRNKLRQRVVSRPEETTTRVFLLSQASPALKALLATANEEEETEETEAAAEEDLTEDVKAAIREMHEDNNEEEGVNTQDPQLPPTDLDSATTKLPSPQRGKGSTNSSPRQVLFIR